MGIGNRESGVGNSEQSDSRLPTLHSLICIGTSATMSSEGTKENRQKTVAQVASKLFGVEIQPQQVIDETLEKAIIRPYPTVTELQDSINEGLPPIEQKRSENSQNESNKLPLGLPFRLHQFISQGGSVYATLEAHDKRELTLEGQYKTTGDRLLFPLVFCRECGHDYYGVKYDQERNQVTPLLPTTLEEEEDTEEGYITLFIKLVLLTIEYLNFPL